MAIFNPSPNPTNDPSYLNYAQDLDKQQINRGLSNSIESFGQMVQAGAKAGVSIIGDAIQREAYARTDQEFAAAGVNTATDAAAAGVPIGTTKGDPANNIFNENSDRAVNRPAGFDRFEERIAALKQKYEEGGMSETYFSGRIQAHTREMVNRYGDAWRPEIDSIMKRITGVDANHLRKSIVADLDRAERARQGAESRDETYVRNHAQFISPGMMQRWQRKEVSINQVVMEASGRQFDAAEVTRSHARLTEAKARGEASDEETVRVATREVNIASRQRMTELVADSGGLKAVLDTIKEGKAPTAKQQEVASVAFTQYREKIRNDIRQKLANPVYDSMKPEAKEKLIAESTKDIDEYEKALYGGKPAHGRLFQTAVFNEALADQDMRTVLEKVPGLRIHRTIGAVDKNGKVLDVMLRDDSTGGFLQTLVKAGRTAAALNLADGATTITQTIDGFSQARDAQGGNAGALSQPSAIKLHIRDVANVIEASSKDPNPAVLKNYVNGVFGPSEGGLLTKFNKDSRAEVFTTLASPRVTAAMLRLKEEDPASWNMYTKAVTDMFNSQARPVGKDLKDNFAAYEDVVSIRFDDQAMRFVVEPKEIQRPSNEQFKGQSAGIIAGQIQRQKEGLKIADGLNAHLMVLQPIIEANGGDKAKVVRDVLNSIGVDPSNPKDKGFWESIGQKLFGSEPDPNKNPYRFNDLSSPGMKDDKRDEAGLINLQGEVGKPDEVQSGILRVIRRAEAGGGSGAYGRVFGTKNNYPLEKMTLNQVMALQSQMRASGSPSTAVGAYQFLNKTLSRLKNEVGLTGEEKFDATLQDRLAVALMKGRGYDDWQAGKITRKQFVDSLAKEWAGLPNTGGRSHYEGDGLNRATIKLRDLLAALPQPEKPDQVASE